MATTSKGSSGARSGSKSGSKTDMTAKATSKSSKVTKANKESVNRAAMQKSGTSKKTNSGGTTRTASKQAEPTKTKQAKAANSRLASGSTAAKSTSAKSGKGRGNGVVSKVMRAVGLTKTVNAEAIGLLEKDHRRVEELFEKVKANEDGNNKAVFKRIKSELDVHTHIEEKVFYPLLLKKGDEDLQKIVREGIEEHRQAKTLLVELAGMTGTSETFKARLKVLMEDIEHHVKEEEGEMFPMVEDQFDEKTREKLGARLQAEKAKFKERVASRSTAATKAAKTRAAGA